VHNYRSHFQNLLWSGRTQFVICWLMDWSIVLWVLSICGKKWYKNLVLLLQD
jgi:hypothetical protein